MELRQYLRLFRRWFWLVLLAAFLGGGVAFLARSGQPSTYRAEATLLIGNYIDEPNPTTGVITLGEKLAQTYAVMAKTYTVLNAAVEDGVSDSFDTDSDAPRRPLPESITPSALGNALEVRIISGTSLLVLSVTYTDPVLAADMANAVAQALIAKSPTNLTPEQQEQRDSANAEIEDLKAQIQAADAELAALDQQLAEVTVANAERLELIRQRNALIEQKNSALSTIAGLRGTITQLELRANSLDIVEPARIPGASNSPSVLNTTLLGALVGAALAVGVALLVEYLDDTLKTPEETTQALALPILGTIVRFGKPDEAYTNRLVTQADPSSPVAESYRALRTNLLFSTNNVVKRAFIVTSPGPEEGKTVTAANLAVVMAASGLRVLLIDADLRRPKVHQVFSLENRVGLTTLLSASPARTATNADENEDFRRCLQDTAVPGLRVITSGFIPSNPTEVLGSALMQRWFQVFLSSQNVDVVLFDTPPALFMADSSVLAATINVPVVLVLEAGRTRRSAALRAKEQFAQLHVDVRGVILNMVKPVEHGYGYGYGNYYYYYSSDLGPPSQRTGLRRLFARNGKAEGREEEQHASR
ncbi:MAG: hypothetical protein Kow00120_03610 [Anaerolineae bacterium]